MEALLVLYVVYVKLAHAQHLSKLPVNITAVVRFLFRSFRFLSTLARRNKIEPWVAAGWVTVCEMPMLANGGMAFESGAVEGGCSTTLAYLCSVHSFGGQWEAGIRRKRGRRCVYCVFFLYCYIFGGRRLPRKNLCVCVFLIR